MAIKTTDTSPVPYRTKLVPHPDLNFDAKNPRLVEAGGATSQMEILRVLWREFAVEEIAMSIAANGYFPYEPLFVVSEGGNLVVVEGNRRLAAVRLLTDEKLRADVGATGLPKITAAAKHSLENLPIVECARKDIWQYVGFKHVNGPQQWQSYSKAQYIAWVRNVVGVTLEEIATQIGDQHSTVERLYRALMVLDQAEHAGVFQREDRYKTHFSFSHLYTGLDYPGIQRFLGISPSRTSKKKPVPESRLKNLRDLCLWLFGSKSKEQPPVVRSQNPDLRILDEVLLSKNGTAALRRGLPLTVAQEIGKGDEKLFREAIVSAKLSLQQARGKLLTGYGGESDLMKTAEEVSELASDICEEMGEVHGKRTAGRTAQKRGR